MMIYLLKVDSVKFATLNYHRVQHITVAMRCFGCVRPSGVWRSRTVAKYGFFWFLVKGSLGGETSVLRTFRMSGKELVKERVSKERVSQRNS